MIDQISKNILIASGKLEKEKQYWLDKLSGDITISSFLPGGPGFQEVPGERKKGEKRERVPFRFHGDVYDRLMRIGGASAYGIFTLLVSGLNCLLYKYTGNEDNIIGTPVFREGNTGSRQDVNINSILPLRCNSNGKMTFKNLAIHARRVVTEANENKNYPFDELLKLLTPPSLSSLFDVTVTFQNIHDDRALDVIKERQCNTHFSFSMTDAVIEGEIDYSTALFDKLWIESLIKHYINFLKQATLDPLVPLADIDIFSAEEKQRLLVDFNNTSTDYPRHKTLHELFELQVEKTPNGTAVISMDLEEGEAHRTVRHALTYRELNKKANRLAGVLRNRGLASGETVGLMFPHSIDLAAGILGVLKAGGACFLVDAYTPTRRLISMLEDCKADILLTRSAAIKANTFTRLQEPGKIGVNANVTSLRPQVTDLDMLPFPNRRLVIHKNYNPYIGDAMVKNTYISIQATRGCPYNCAYCHKIWPKSHIIRSAENIFAEVKLYYDMGVRRFSFVDDIFNLKRENSTRFYKLLIKNRLDVELFFPNGLRGDIMTEDYIDLLIEAGTKCFSLALETASPRLQKLIGKNIKIDKLHENLEYICEKYPHVIIELFTMHGFPTETEEEAMMTLNFVKSLKWLHFPYVNILRIYSNTDMEKLALANGIKKSEIVQSEELAYHELPDTLPFDKNFTIKYQAEFLNEYFLLKERLLHVLPYQLQTLTRDEMAQKYNSYLPAPIKTFEDVLRAGGIEEEELTVKQYLDEDHMLVSDLDYRMRKCLPGEEERLDDKALRILLLDLSQLFNKDKGDMLYDLVEAPLGLMYLLTYLDRRFGSRVKGKILKSRIDFDSYRELKELLKEFNPDLIGIRTLTFFKDFFHKTAAVIRQWGIEAPIITGGPYASSNYNAILQDRNIDLAVLGEGEITFAEVIQKIMDNDGKLPGEEVLKEIPGIAFIPEKEALGKTFARHIIMMDELGEELENRSSQNLVPTSTSFDLAFTVFTSGSTGKPKGTMLHHQGVSNHVFTKIKELGIDSNDVLCHSMNISFVASIWQFFAPFLTGTKLLLYPEGVLSNPYEFFRQVEADRVSIVEVVPSYLTTYLELLESGKEKLDLESLKMLVLTGEKVSPSLVNTFYKEYRIPLLNAYGQSECSDDTLHYQIPYNPETLEVPIGIPANNTQVFILGKNRQLQPVGVYGELCISGDGLALGYLNSPELTAEKFVFNPYIPGKKMFLSGDIASWLPDGNIEFSGRIDQQVKIRGFRIELDEIKSQLLNHDHVQDAVVMAREESNGETGDKYLCAYVVPGSLASTGPGNSEYNFSELRDYLSRQLPDYMIPSYYVVVERIPLTASGKVNWQVLPDPLVIGLSNPREELLDPIEQSLTQVWSEVLKINEEKIGIHTNFFESGGNSLKAVTLAAKIHKKLNVNLSLMEIFDRPILKSMAQYIKEAAEDPFTALEPLEKKEYYVVSSAQKRMYTWQQMSPGSIVYNVSQVVALEGEQHADLLEETFRKLIKRHESLCTSFEIINEEPIQRIHDYRDVGSQFEIEHYECKSEDDNINIEQRSMEIQGILGRVIRPFDLREAPLIRVGLIHTPPFGPFRQGSHNSQEGIRGDQYILVVDMHHIISDGRSNDILIKDFMDLYKGNPLSELNLQYKEFSEWQNRLIGGKNGLKQGQEEYWLKQFEGKIPVLNLPTDSARPEVPDFDGKSAYFEIDEETTESLRTLALKEETTFYMLFLALVNVLLSRLSGQEDIVVGTPLAGRRHADLENIIGFFINTLPLRNFPSGEKSFLEFLKDVKDNTLNAFENQDYPFEELVEKLKIDRDTSRNPLFDVTVELRKVEGESGGAGEAEAGSREVEVDTGMRVLTHQSYQLKAPFDLDFFVTEVEKKMMVRILYMTELFKEETIQRFIGYFHDLVASVLENDVVKLEDIKISHELVDVVPGEFVNEQGDFDFGF